MDILPTTRELEIDFWAADQGRTALTALTIDSTSGRFKQRAAGK